MTTDIKTNYDYIKTSKNDEGKYECERCQTAFNDESEVCWANIGDFCKEYGVPLCADCCEDQIENWAEIEDESEEEEDTFATGVKQMEEMAVRLGVPAEATAAMVRSMTEIKEKIHAEEDEDKANELLATWTKETTEAAITRMEANRKQVTEVIAFLTKENKELKMKMRDHEDLKRKMRYLELNNWTVFCEVQEYGNESEDEESEDEESEDEESEDEN
jgi:hypothetical protein